MKINFIGVGAQKCASTWVHRVLSDHPEVAIYQGKESDFFSTYYGRGYQWYEKQVGDTSTVSAKGEISPSYFSNSDTPSRVFLYNSAMRIVLLLRDPIERAYSNHLHVVRQGYLTGQKLSFEDGLANNPMYIEQSRYARHLARWFEVFPKNQVLAIFQEDIRDNPQMQARNLYRFLRINENHQSWFLEKRVNESVVVKNAKLDLFLKQLGKIGRYAGGKKIVEAVKNNDIIRNLRRNHNQIQLREVIPPMREDTRKHLQDVLADDMNELLCQLNLEKLPWESWLALQHESSMNQLR